MTKSQAGRSRASGRITLAMVAKHAGVATMTASRAITQPDMVSQALRDRVDKAVIELGYVPNRAARALASSQSKVIAVLVPSLSNAVFTEVLAGIQDALDADDYQILIGNTRYSDQEEEKLIGTYLQSNPDGMLLSGLSHCAGVVVTPKINARLKHIEFVNLKPGRALVGGADAVRPQGDLVQRVSGVDLVQRPQ